MDETSSPSPLRGAPSVQEGALLFERYRVIRQLRQERGRVEVLAEDTRLAQQIHVALVPDHLWRDPEIRDGVRQEVRSVMRLRHPALIPLFEWHEGEDSAALVHEWWEGPTLAELLAAHPHGCFDPQDILPWLESLAGLLDYLHSEAGIVMGDLQPGRVVRDPRGRIGVRLPNLDRVLDVAPPDDSRVHVFTDGLPYQSPQQIAGEAVRREDDIYALGALTYTLLTGAPPFGPLTGVPLIMAVMQKTPPPIAERRRERGLTDGPPFPEAWEQAVAAALAKDPAARPRRAGDFLKMLLAACPTTQAVPTPPDLDEMLQRLARPELESVSELPRPVEPAPFLDENVQFTVFRLPGIEPLKWYPLPAFAHLAERPPDAPEGEPDPVEEVERQARAVLGEAFEEAKMLVQDSRMTVPREGEITFVPEVTQVTFNPPRATFLWIEPVHRVDFRMRAAADTAGQTLRGRLTVFLGQMILSDIPLVFRAEAQVAPRPERPVAESARPYRKIFASYSHRDGHVVQQFERYVGALGDEYLRDAIHLRAGEVWNEKLKEMIRQADVFQLFWSWNSMRSRYCREEWEYALALNKENFVRPTYWESPIPAAPEEGLPGDQLRKLHFQKIAFGPDDAGASSPHGTPSPRAEADIGTKCDLEPIASRPIAAPPAPLSPPRAPDTCAMSPTGSAHPSDYPPPYAPSPMMASGSGPGWLVVAVLVGAAVLGALGWLLFGW